LKPGC